MTTMQVLLLNADYSPMKILDWQTAVCLMLAHKVSVVEEYAGRVIRSASAEFPWPAVVALKQYAASPTKVRFNRANVLARDRYTCMYCGVRPVNAKGRPKIEELTIEHIVPRSRAKDNKVTLPWNGKVVGVTSWLNVVAACGDCNLRKANRTPDEAGMALRGLPFVPDPWEVLRIRLTRVRVPSEWKLYLPENAKGWGGYWEDELDSE